METQSLFTAPLNDVMDLLDYLKHDSWRCGYTGKCHCGLDAVTGHWVGWRPCYREEPADKYHFEAFDALEGKADGTYELLGPKVQGNQEKIAKHILFKHSDAEVFPDCPRDFNGLRNWFIGKDIEGIVFHHPDGRMVKIKLKDFGIRRSVC